MGLIVRPSTNKRKKIDVYKNGKLVASIGAIGYNDYPTFLIKESQGIYPSGHAAKRRKQYKIRHNSYRSKVGTNSYYADQLIW
jgi:hypothetical protein